MALNKERYKKAKSFYDTSAWVSYLIFLFVLFVGGIFQLVDLFIADFLKQNLGVFCSPLTLFLRWLSILTGLMAVCIMARYYSSEIEKDFLQQKDEKE